MKSLVVVAALGLALTACGSGGSSSPSAAPPSTSEVTDSISKASPPKSQSASHGPAPAAEIRAAAQAYSDAFLTGKADAAYALLSGRCQARLSQAEFAAEVGQAKAVYGAAIPFTTFKAEVNGEQARVTYTYSTTPAINQTQEPWVKEDGTWHEDDC